MKRFAMHRASRWALAIALVTVGHATARADVSAAADPGTLVASICGRDPQSVLDAGEARRFRAFCDKATARLGVGARQLLPPTYYKRRLGIQWCEPDDQARAALAGSFEGDAAARAKLDAAFDEAKQLSRMYGCIPSPLPGGAKRVGTVATGIADFFFSYALEEVIDYVVQDHLKTLCLATPESGKLSLGALFTHACGVVFPGGKTDGAIYDAAMLRRLKKALVLDLQELAMRAWAWAARRVEGKLEPRLVDGLRLVVGSAQGIATGSVSPRDLLHLAAKYALEVLPATPDPKVCLLDPARGAWFDGHRARCLGLLAAQLVESYQSNGVVQSIDRAAKQFCASFGKAGSEQDAKCLFDGQSYEALNAKLVALAGALAKVEEAFELAASEPRDADSWSRVAAALSELVDAARDLVDTTELKDAKQVGQAIDLAASLSGFAVALAARDTGAMRTHLLAALGNELIQSSLTAKAIKVVTFAFSLYEAKDRSDVEQILKDLAAPVGTYRRKYGLAGSTGVTINGWVGGYGGYALRFHDTAAPADGFTGGLALPIGLDVQPARLSGERTRLSFGVTLIDPLGAAQLDESKEVPDAKLISIINLGVHATVGFARSPIVLRAAAEYRPGLYSEGMCGTDRCYRGSALFTLGLAIDVPVLVLR